MQNPDQKMLYAKLGDVSVSKTVFKRSDYAQLEHDITSFSVTTKDGSIDVDKRLDKIFLDRGKTIEGYPDIEEQIIKGKLGKRLGKEALAEIKKIMKDGNFTSQEASEAAEIVHNAIQRVTAQKPKEAVRE